MVTLSWLEIIVGIVTVIMGNQGVSALLKVRSERRHQGAETVKVEAETVQVHATASKIQSEAFTALVGVLQSRLEVVESAQAGMDEKLKKVLLDNSILVAHIDVLENHIQAQLPPPPPVRPKFNYFPTSLE